MQILDDGTRELNPAWPSNSQESPGSKQPLLVYISAQSQALVSIYQKGNEKNTIHTLKQTNTQKWVVLHLCILSYDKIHSMLRIYVTYMLYMLHMIYTCRDANTSRSVQMKKKNCQNFVQCHRHTPFSSKNRRGGSFERMSPQEEHMLKTTNKNLISKISAVFLHTPLL